MLDIVEDDGSIRRLEVAHADPSRDALAQELRRFPAGPTNPGSPASRVLETGRSTLLSDTVDDRVLVAANLASEHLELLRALKPCSALAVPLLARGRTLGALSLFAAESGRHYSATDLGLVEELARRCALSVDNARILAAERRERVASQSLQAITAALSTAITPAETGEMVIQHGLPAIGADAGAVAMLDDMGTALEMVRSLGYPQDMQDAFQHTVLTASTPMAEAARTGQPVWRLAGPASDAAFADYSRVNRRFPVGIALPLVVDGRVRGALALSFSRERTFDEHDRAFAITLAAQCALALERARLYAAEQRARTAAEASLADSAAAQQRLEFLAEASTILSLSLDYEETLARLAQLAVPRLADACVVDVLRLDRSVQRLPMVFAADVEPHIQLALAGIGPPTLDGPGAAAHVLRSGEPLMIPVVDDATLVASARDAHHLALLRAAGIRSSLLIPLQARGTVLGALTLVTASSGRTYAAADLRLTEELARRAAQALDNARLFAAEQDARSAAEAAVRARDEFLSIASHELRTPVAAIKSLAQLLLRSRRSGKLDQERLDRSLTQIASSSDRLAALTEDLLDVSRLQTGRLELHLQVLALDEVVFECVESCRAQLDARHSLELLVSESVRVALDRLRFEQVVANLVSNAAKYSPAGGAIEVSVCRAADGAQVSVRDHGIGLPPSQKEVIFQPFGRAANASVRHIQGMGLGLYICRQIMERHGGRIWVESEGEGEGTTLSLWLPAAN